MLKLVEKLYDQTNISWLSFCILCEIQTDVWRLNVLYNQVNLRVKNKIQDVGATSTLQ